MQKQHKLSIVFGDLKRQVQDIDRRRSRTVTSQRTRTFRAFGHFLLFSVIGLLVGVLLWAYVLSQFCDMATNSSPGNTEFKQLLPASAGSGSPHKGPKGEA